MSDKTLFPKPGQIFKRSTRDLTDSIGRPSLDTLYQVLFSFGNYETWLQDSSEGEAKRGVFAQGGFREKLSIMCAEAEIPGTSFQTSLAVGHHQGIQEEFPNRRTFPPLNLTFYVDADHVVLEIFESWMTYINPITNAKRSVNTYGRFNYPRIIKKFCTLQNLKEILSLKRLMKNHLKLLTHQEQMW